MICSSVNPFRRIAGPSPRAS